MEQINTLENQFATIKGPKTDPEFKCPILNFMLF